MNKGIFLFGFILLILSCQDQPKFAGQKEASISKADSVFSVTKDSMIGVFQKDISRQYLPVDFEAAKTINVLSADKKTHADSEDNEYLRKCETWELRESDIKRIVRFLKPIDQHDFSYLYYVLPCEFNGEIEVDNQTYSYVINAGAFMKLTNTDTTFIYGCDSRKCNKFFLVEGGTQ